MLLEWVKSKHEEGLEEVGQGIVERFLQKAMLGAGNAAMSATDREAVLSLYGALDEYMSGFVVGAILGGAQSLGQIRSDIQAQGAARSLNEARMELPESVRPAAMDVKSATPESVAAYYARLVEAKAQAREAGEGAQRAGAVQVEQEAPRGLPWPEDAPQAATEAPRGLPSARTLEELRQEYEERTAAFRAANERNDPDYNYPGELQRINALEREIANYNTNNGGLNNGQNTGERRGNRADDLGAGGEAGAVPAEGTGRAQGADAGRAGEAGQGVGDPARADLREVTPAELGIRNGSSESITLVDPRQWSADARSASVMARANGLEPVAFRGEMYVGGGAVDGYIQGNRLFFRVDAADANGNAITAQQITKHELYHDRHGWDPELTEQAAAKIRETMGEARFDRMQEAYQRAYEKVEDFSNMTAEEIADYLYQEICADAYAGLNWFAGEDLDEASETVRGMYEESARANPAGAREGASEGRALAAGIRAQTADSGTLAQAEQMERDGAGNEEIRQETGWYRGTDGQWRFEIDDSVARYYRNGDAQFRKDHPEYARYQELTEKMLNGTISDEEFAELRELAPTWSAEERRLQDMANRGMVRLDMMLDHPALYEAYPELRNARVMFGEMGEGEKGSYNQRTNTITISNELRNAPESTLIHEIQHAIQKAEGFTGGASTAYWEERLKNGYAQERATAEIKEADRKYRELFDSAPENLKNKIRELNRAKLQNDLDLWDQLEAELYDGPYSDLFVQIDQADFERRRLRFAERTFQAKELYRDTAGEIEARDAAARRGMTAEERKNTPPDLGDEDTVFAEENRESYNLVGYRTDGIEVYETSPQVKALSWKDRRRQFMKLMENKYRGRTARFNMGGKTLYARFAAEDINKNIYGDKRSDDAGRDAKINAGADGDIFDLVENAKYNGSANEQGKTTKAHRGVKIWDYFIKKVQIDGKVFDLVINVREASDGEYVYSLQLNEDKNTGAAPPVRLAKDQSFNGAQTASTNSITSKSNNSNSFFSENSADDAAGAPNGRGSMQIEPEAPTGLPSTRLEGEARGLPSTRTETDNEAPRGLPSTREEIGMPTLEQRVQTAAEMAQRGALGSEIYEATGLVKMANGDIINPDTGTVERRGSEYGNGSGNRAVLDRERQSVQKETGAPGSDRGGDQQGPVRLDWGQIGEVGKQRIRDEINRQARNSYELDQVLSLYDNNRADAIEEFARDVYGALQTSRIEAENVSKAAIPDIETLLNLMENAGRGSAEGKAAMQIEPETPSQEVNGEISRRAEQERAQGIEAENELAEELTDTERMQEAAEEGKTFDELLAEYGITEEEANSDGYWQLVGI